MREWLKNTFPKVYEFIFLPPLEDVKFGTTAKVRKRNVEDLDLPKGTRIGQKIWVNREPEGKEDILSTPLKPGLLYARSPEMTAEDLEQIELSKLTKGTHPPESEYTLNDEDYFIIKFYFAHEDGKVPAQQAADEINDTFRTKLNKNIKYGARKVGYYYAAMERAEAKRQKKELYVKN